MYTGIDDAQLSGFGTKRVLLIFALEVVYPIYPFLV